MKNLPPEERPYEKCLKYGPSRLTDAELLAVIIRTGSKGTKALSLAKDILKLSGAPNGLLGPDAGKRRREGKSDPDQMYD